jgi:predicted PhzF superfamily epimerase YddE/YHI9
MSKNIEVHILRAFVNEEGKFGNPTGIVIDVEQSLNPAERQYIATELYFTDTVFINNLNAVDVSFFNPQQETKFAGDSLISTSYFLKNVLHLDRDTFQTKAGSVKTWVEGELTWIEASVEGTAPWIHKQVESAAAIDAITPEEASKFEHTMVWAWDDENAGRIRSRTFLPDWGTLEDQGNGSGSMQLARMLGKDIEIHQGLGSIIFARPSEGTNAKVGGRVVVEPVRTITI